MNERSTQQYLWAPAGNVEGSRAKVGNHLAAMVEQLHLGWHMACDYAEAGALPVPGHILHIAFLQQTSPSVISAPALTAYTSNTIQIH